MSSSIEGDFGHAERLERVYKKRNLALSSIYFYMLYICILLKN